MVDRACGGPAFPNTVEKAFAGPTYADFVPNFWNVMNVKAKNGPLASTLLKILQKNGSLTPKMGGAIFDTKKELPI